MDQQKLRQIEARCTQEAMPRCQAACPLRLDVRAFMDRMAAGDMAGARLVLERHLPLPALLARICDHPCEDACLRRDLGGSLNIGGLEALCVAQAGRQGRVLPRTPKEGNVAVLGAGLAGLVVAHELTRKAWPVTVFHEGAVHEVLVARFPQLAEEVVKEECAALVRAGCRFVETRLDQEQLAAARKGFAAVFIDADAAPELFALFGNQPDPVTCLLDDTLCAGGEAQRGPLGHVWVSSSRQAGQGRRAAATLERLLSGVSLTAERGHEQSTSTPLHTPLDGVEPMEAVLPGEAGFTPADGAREAARCLHCQCLTCVKACVYLQQHKGHPRTYARQIYNNASIVKGEHMANRLVNGCTLCGQCTELCPERFSMAELCLEARRDMVTRHFMPPSAHEFALEDMASASGPEAALALPDPAGRPTAWAFFPGCQLAASRGDAVLAVYDFLRERLLPHDGVGLLLGCCGVPAHWAGRDELLSTHLATLREQWEELGRPTLIMACASCRKLLREHAPQIPQAAQISLWELLAARDAFADHVATATARLTCVVHDPCAARHDQAWQKSVRHLAASSGLNLVEPPHTGTTTACCGYGGLVWCARPELAEAMAEQRGAELGAVGGIGLASCIMCRDRLVSQGQPCLHLLDVLPLDGATPASCEAAAHSPPPGLSARRAGRAALKRRVLARFGGASAPLVPALRLLIAPELLAHLERRHILQSDCEQAVLAVATSGRAFLEQHSGHFVGSWRPRNVTYWVRYSVEETEKMGRVYRLHDAWCHRMLVPNTGGGCLP